MANKVELLLDLQSPLCESPVWNSLDSSLYWDDFHDRRIYKYDIGKKDLSYYSLAHKPGSFAFTDRGNIIVAFEKSIGLFDVETKSMFREIQPEKDIIGNHFNDGKCDGVGRFWVGSMTENQIDANARLYAVKPGLEYEIKLEDVRTSNGLCWNMDNTVMYYIDSLKYSVSSFLFDMETGSIYDRKEVVSFSSSEGVPDGMTIDKDGNIWIAHWHGAAISQWDPKCGRCIKKYSVPAYNVTSCCFGGENMDVLFITSARSSTDDLVKYPLSGGIFYLQTDTSGFKSICYKE